MRSQLIVDADGTVCYGDFVRVAKQIFQDELLNRELPPSLLEHVPPQQRSILKEITHQVATYCSSCTTIHGTGLYFQHNHSDSVDAMQLQQENNSLRIQIHELNKQLHQQVLLTARREKELLVLRKVFLFF